MHFVVFGEDVRFGLAYGVTTIGTDDDALTVGLGWAYARYHENEYDPSCPVRPPVGVADCTERTTKTPGSPIAMVGGEHRVSRRIKVVTENYVFESGGLVSLGVRFLGDRLSADLGFFTPLSSEEMFLAPIVNFVWTFGPR